MICIIALFVFGILAIFSASYRPLAKEALDCVFRKMTFRKCHSNLDKRLKSGITGKLMTKHPRFAKSVYRNFEIISWIFLILMIASIALTARSVYFYAAYGNCNGPTDDAFCIFDPLGTSECSEATAHTDLIPANAVEGNSPSKGEGLTIIEFGCYSCPYTREAEENIQRIAEEYPVKFVFRNFPIPAHPGGDLAAQAALCADEQEKFWEYHNKIFGDDAELSQEYLRSMAVDLDLDIEGFDQCLDSGKYNDQVKQDFEDGLKAGVYGTPTLFIGDKGYVGPKTYKFLKTIVEEELA